ncbi:hypothetical protein DPMN_158085 [Dreissena polymorpha]|uniref:Uncharacterized protein n=1 Tax=Dreissena polymorpha TaxID=45954 RepID=A0A9D4ELT2_DREPO|nr:hypothetical protein DPMN_158085 [Dreissena polymorpha]
MRSVEQQGLGPVDYRSKSGGITSSTITELITKTKKQNKQNAWLNALYVGWVFSPISIRSLKTSLNYAIGKPVRPPGPACVMP